MHKFGATFGERFSFFKKSKLGFTLVETMVTMGIASGLVLGVMEAVNMSARSVRSVQTSNDWTTLIANLRTMTQNPTQCKYMFSGLVFPNGPTFGTSAAPVSSWSTSVLCDTNTSMHPTGSLPCTTTTRLNRLYAYGASGTSLNAMADVFNSINGIRFLYIGLAVAVTNVTASVPIPTGTSGYSYMYQDLVSLEFFAKKQLTGTGSSGQVTTTDMTGAQAYLYSGNAITSRGTGILFKVLRDKGTNAVVSCFGTDDQSQLACAQMGGQYGATGDSPYCQLSNLPLNKNKVLAAPSAAAPNQGARLTLYNNGTWGTPDPTDFAIGMGVDSWSGTPWMWSNAGNQSYSGFLWTNNSGTNTLMQLSNPGNTGLTSLVPVSVYPDAGQSNALYTNMTKDYGNSIYGRAAGIGVVGVEGYAYNAAGNNIVGVMGASDTGTGVYMCNGVGSAPANTIGVCGTSTNGTGVVGQSSNGVSGFFETAYYTNAYPTLVARVRTNQTADAFQVQNNGGASLVDITSAGYVGIGTTSPQAALHVSGYPTVAFPWGFLIQQYIPTWGVNATRPIMRESWDMTNGDLLYIGGTGNRSNSSESAIMLTSGLGIRFGAGDDSGVTLSAEYMRLAAGRLYFNGYNLGDGQVGITGTHGWYAALGLNMPNAWAVVDNYIGFFNSGGLQGYINAGNGSIGIWNASDIRLKTDIEKYSTALGDLDRVGVYRYLWKGKEKGSKEKLYGVIAQEVEKVFPDFVSERNDGMLSVSYEKFVPVVMGAVKELDAKFKDISGKFVADNENHEHRLKVLEKENVELRAQLDRLQSLIDKKVR